MRFFSIAIMFGAYIACGAVSAGAAEFTILDNKGHSVSTTCPSPPTIACQLDAAVTSWMAANNQRR